MRFFFFYLLLVLFIFPDTIHAQQKGWQELTISEGLSQGMVFDIKQDRNGFIWIATKEGLNRYDGYNFNVFTHDPYNPYSISDNVCSALLLDRHNRLWIGTLNKGLDLYDERTQRFFHIDIRDQKVLNGTSFDVKILAEDPEGNIWVGTGTGQPIKITLPASLQQGFPDQPDFTDQVQLTPLQLASKVSNSLNLDFSFKPNGEALTALNNGIYTFNWKKPIGLTKYNLFQNEPSDIFDFYYDVRHDFLVISTSHQLKCWYKGVQKTIALPLSSGQGVKIKPIDANTIALSVVSHLWLLSPEALFSKDSLTEQNAYVTFPPNLYAITKIMTDNTGNLWIGTSGYGLRKFNPRVNQFQSYLPQISLSQLYIDRQGRTYGRSQDAYGLIDRQSNRLLPFLDNRLSEADRKQSFIMQDRQGIFWVSNTNYRTQEPTLFKFSSNWDLLRKYPLPTGIKFGSWVNQTLEDPDGKLWIGALKGKLLRFDPKTEAFQVFNYLPHSHDEIDTYALLREPDGTFWIGMQQGLVKAEHLLTKPTYTHYKNSITNRQSLSNDFVLSLANDPNEPDRYLWIGTKGGGLERLDKQTGLFTHFTEAQGLPNRVVYGILSDERKNLWLSTNKGLSRFNPKTLVFRNYTKADGLQDDEFNTGSYFKSSAGELLFGGVNGITRFRPSSLLGRANQRPKLIITGLKVNNNKVEAGDPTSILTESIELTRELNLKHDQNLLTFEFAVMDYTNVGKNRFRYRLEGIDQDWVEAGTNRFANYAQLPDGKYTLNVMGSTDGEVWSDLVTLPIRIYPPFYRTWWAYLGYTILLAIAVWQLYRFQRQRLLLHQRLLYEQQEAGRLAELDTLKNQFFTNISHEIRTPLTLIVGPVEQMAKEFSRDTRFALLKQNANRLLSLINQLLDISKLEAGQLKPELISGDVATFLRVLASSFKSLAESRQIEFAFWQDIENYWVWYDQDKLEKIVTNVLLNAFKFTPPGGSVRMELKHHSDRIFISIEDTGIGIAQQKLPRIFDRFYQVDGNVNRSHGGTGIGLALVRELVKVLGGTISVDSTEGVGTTFRLALPIRPVSETEAALLPDASLPTDTVGRSVPTPRQQVDTENVSEEGRVGAFDSQENAKKMRGSKPTDAPESVLLIIDDNPDIRTYVRGIFEHEYQILEAADGQQGLDMATASIPDLVICDLMMPRLDGFGFCRALKSQMATSHIPVVMLTARATVEDRIEGFELGADEYLTKPFNQIEIQVRVRNLIRQRERLGQYFQERLGLVPAPVRVDEDLIRKENNFLQSVQAIVEDQLTDRSFDVEQLSERLNLSQRQLVRKLKALTGQTAVEFIRNCRLERAATLIQEGQLSVSEVAYQVGFESLSYFTRSFQEKFGVLPSAYVADQEKT
ncbi:ATP-binding protein [Spirosoma sp. 48-14]|uniref:hybrid sensor histidine kinase/response regulator transcription factor n=1 Tax=Spirosoma sp. 48-14 TaxID=1895854 RepID=UPI000963FCC1|nr:ATP-binding protein [Spirosoma sp. 48-14]OJW76267.1 MAG: hybrid sensor histidine kinase/response regulator [Spirosoma sp. 48-14]